MEEEEEDQSVEDSEEGSEEDSPGSLFLFFWGGLQGTLVFGLAFVLFWGAGVCFTLGVGVWFGLGGTFPYQGGGLRTGGGGGSRVAAGERGPGTGCECCPSPPLASPRRYYGRPDGRPGLSVPPLLQLAAGEAAAART